MKKIIELKNIGKIIFRHVKKADIEGIWNNFNEVLKEGIYLPVFSPVSSEYEKNAWYNSLKKEKEICIVAEHSDLESPYNIIGQCEVSNSQWEAAAHVGILGIIIKKKYRDLGIGYHLIDIALRESKKLNNKEKIILSCFANNERGLKLYKKIGFIEVGVRKKQFYMNGTYYDEVLMEIFIDDYLKKIKNKYS